MLARMTTHTPHERLRQQARELGIDQSFISQLVDRFYERVRAHPQLGPIFENVVHDDWEPHLDTMKRFWSSMALGAGTYSGRPMPKHVALRDQLEPALFNEWLHLFNETLNELTDNVQTVEFFMMRAHRVADNMRSVIFGQA